MNYTKKSTLAAKARKTINLVLKVISKPKRLDFYDEFHCLNPKCGFVKNQIYATFTIERIQEPFKNCLALFPKLLPILSHITKVSLGSDVGLSEAYIAKQLKYCKELILVRNRHDAVITHYLRFDVFSNISSGPCALAMYKIPQLKESKITNNLTLHILKDELESRVTLENTNPEISFILRTDNPKIYQMRTKLTDKIYPDLHKVINAFDCFLKKQIALYLQQNQIEKINELIDKNLIMSRERVVCSTLNDLKRALPDIKLNLAELKRHKNSSLGQVNLLATELDKIYKAHIPEKYLEAIRQLMKMIYNHNDLHNYEVLIAKDATPDVKINNCKEQAYDPIINDFYTYYLSDETSDLIMINFEVNLSYINEALTHINK